MYKGHQNTAKKVTLIKFEHFPTKLTISLLKI